MVRQGEQLGELAIINAGQSAVLSEQFLENYEGTDLVVIDAK